MKMRSGMQNYPNGDYRQVGIGVFSQFPKPNALLSSEKPLRMPRRSWLGEGFEDAKKKLAVGTHSFPFEFPKPNALLSSEKPLRMPRRSWLPQKLPGPRVPQGHPHHEDEERDAGNQHRDSSTGSNPFPSAWPSPYKVQLSTTKSDGSQSFPFEFPNAMPGSALSKPLRMPRRSWQKLPGPRVPQGHPHHEDEERDAGNQHQDSSTRSNPCPSAWPSPYKVQLSTTKAVGTHSFAFEFSKPNALLNSSKYCLDPEFLKAIPTMKMRSGMQALDEELPSCTEASVETTSSEEEPEAGFMPITGRSGQSRRGESPAEGRALRRSSRGSFTWGSLEDLLSLDPEGHESSMWLGCEDGCIHV
ncbi:uncharacterized protein [Melanerpes formicivorus]|uniref:uncharacterized protein n=1 Tax=Melanerpes formicivorus TaxID=211600 RepID=UPI00358DDCD5